MKNYSTTELPREPQRWKTGEYVYYFNHKDNGLQKDGESGSRFEAEMTIVKSLDKGSIEQALIRHFADVDLELKVINNIEVEAKPAIECVKVYTEDAVITAKVSAIITPTEPIIKTK